MLVRFSTVDCPVKESMSIVGALHESPVKSEPPNGEAHFVGAIHKPNGESQSL